MPPPLFDQVFCILQLLQDQLLRFDEQVIAHPEQPVLGRCAGEPIGRDVMMLVAIPRQGESRSDLREDVQHVIIHDEI
jgi:hypothetical protein